MVRWANWRFSDFILSVIALDAQLERHGFGGHCSVILKCCDVLKVVASTRIPCSVHFS